MRKTSAGCLAGLALALVVTSVSYCSAAKGPAITDPDEAGIDFQIQGEYLGKVDREDGKQTWGTQIIALGDGKFELVGYAGGLPGKGWKRGDESHKASGSLDGQKAVFQRDDSTIEVEDGKLSVLVGGKTIGTLKKVERTSPTLGAKPPEDAKVLFDGSSIDQWENAKLVDGKYLGATNCYTKDKFHDHSFHIEFRTPFMPQARGQGRGNSGVYVQSRYEVQVLDSFGLEGKDNECGGIYQVAAPSVNMCLPPLAWQTYDIDFTAARYDEDGKKTKNARITVKHNGVVIHDDVELPNATPGRHQEGPEPDAIFLQDHGDPVVFRNIWVVEK